MDVRSIADEYWTLHQRELHFYNLYLGELKYLEDWDDFSVEGQRRITDEFEAVSRAAALAATEATGPDRSLAETVAAAAEMNAAELIWSGELLMPNLQSGLVSLLLPVIALLPLRTRTDGERYLEKIHRFPRVVDQLIDRLESGAKSGVVPVADNVIESIDKLEELLGTPEGRARFSAQVAPTDEAFPNWSERLAATVEHSMLGELERYKEALRTITLPVARSNEKPGLSHLPGGAEIYRRLAGAYTTLDLDPSEIHQIGLDQVGKLEDEYRSMAGALLGTTDLAEIYRRLRDDESFHHTTADGIVSDALRCLDKAKAAMGDWFGRLPKADCIGSPIDVGAMAYYRGPGVDGTTPGQFFFNTADPSAWATFQVAATAYHEAIPGHHLDTALSMENTDLHDVQRLVYIPAYGEGWALYTERLADEMGLYESDWERVGMLMGDSLRACRLVVDTGLHALGWTRQQAIDFVVEHSPMSLHEITEEIDRYIGLPGQALSYMLGRLHIVELRRRAEETLGERFDIKGFHDAVLGNGTVPLGTLTRRIEEWTAAV